MITSFVAEYVSLWVPSSIKDALRQESKKRNTSMSKVVTEALQQHLKSKGYDVKAA